MGNIFHRLLNWNKKSIPETVDAEQYAEAFGQFKKLLLEQYQIRIQAKTAKRLPINLTAKPTHFGTSPKRAALYFNDLTIESEDIATEIDKILNTHQRLLIIGDPGAGKTTILLFAAINILQDGNLGGNLKLPPKLDALPLILNLATWQKDRNFKEWYAQSIAHTYSLSPVFVEELLRRNAVVPFFDGFDEVAEDSREDCFQKMAAYFGDQRGRQLIISSRKKEYAAANADAPVYAEIEVQPLSLGQIQKALFENGQTYAGDLSLLYALDRDEHLAKAVETPFYLNTASFLFAKSERSIVDFTFKEKSVEGRQEELVQIFVNEEVSNVKDRKPLSFLAKKMEEENFLVFELVKVQPRWPELTWGYLVTIGLLFALIYSIFITIQYIIPVYLFYRFTLEIIKGGFVNTLIDGLIAGALVSWFGGKSIVTTELQSWSFQKFKKEWRNSIFSKVLSYLIVGAVVGLIRSLARALVFGYNLGFEELIYSLIFGLIAGLVYTLVYGLKRAGTVENYLLNISNAYKRYWVALKSGIWNSLILLVSILSGIGFISDDLPYLDMWGIASNFLPIMIFQSKLPHHFSLRLVLYLENKLPLRLVTFLDRMTDQHIFEDNRHTINGKKLRGATWRFRHRILQDYFAKMNV